MYTIKRESSCVRCINVDPIKGTASVHFNDGYVYDYWNVSRFALLNLIKDSAMSLGTWVNMNLIYKQGVQYKLVDFS